MAYTPIKTQGTKLSYLSTEPSTYTDICAIQTISGPDGSAATIDATTLCSTAKEFIVGLPDYGTVSLTGLYDPADTAIGALKTQFDAQTEESFKITLADTGAAEITFDGYVTQFSWDIQPDDVVKVNISIKVTGAVTVTP